MLIGYRRGQGSIILRVKILNSSVSTGAGLTGLSSTSSGLIISTIADTESTATAYTVAASNVETITTNGTFAAPTAGKCRFKEVDSTNHKGVYEIQIADARFNVSNAKSLLVSVSGATNAAETDVVIPLRDLDPYDAVRAGLTALPNVASGQAGAIITSGTGTAQLSVSSGQVTVATNNDKTGYSLTQTFPSNFSSLAITAGGIVTANTTQLAGQTVTAAGAVTFPSTVSSLTAAGVRTELATELGRIDVATSTRLASSAYTTPPTAGAIADAVWDETIGDHLTAGSTGAALNAAGSAGDPWTTTLPGSYTGSQAGKILADILVDTGTTLQAEVDDIQSRLPAALVSGRMDASVGAMAANVLTASALATDAVGEIADGVWDEAYAGHTTAGTFGKLMDILRKANYVTEGSVAAGGTPTTTSFRTNLTAANDTYDNQTLLFISGALAGESVPILTYANTNGLITTQNALTVAPTAADEFVILPDHVHSVAEIATATLTSAMTESYRSAGVAPTLAQAAFELLAHMGDSSISGTTKTLKKIDGTTAKTFTLDSSTAPTSITEAT